MALLNRLVNFEEIESQLAENRIIRKQDKISTKDIAIIGMYSKLPMANNLDEFWDNLMKGEDCVRNFPSQRLEDYKRVIEGEEKLCEAAYLDEIDKFDYELFNISPMEARLMDPNQRLFLQAAWGVLEDAGYSGEKVKGTKTGVYVGHSSDFNLDYHMYIKMFYPKLYENISLAGNVKSIIASRISYLLDLKGPSILVDTACSSALVAVHLACQGILKGDCDMAMAGGVKINLMPIKKGLDNEVGIRSAMDRAKTFDDSSDGIGSGEGVVTILMKQLNKAVEDGDNIYAVIKGSAVNQDGNSIGLTAPNAKAQEAVIIEAWENADINPESILYIEAHGTATNLGDPIEVSGIERAFKRFTGKKNFCAIGSVKTNIGHLDNISGLVGLIKLVLCLKHEKLPRLIHFQRPNRKIDFINSPVYINDKTNNWESDGTKLRGGVSSFGLAGTNCHIVLEQYMEDREEIRKSTARPQIFTLAAKSEEQVYELVDKYLSFLQKNEEADIRDICYTVNTGRVHHKFRIAITANNKTELMEKLNCLKKNYKKIIVKYASEVDFKRLSKLAAETLKEYINSFEREEEVLQRLCDLYVEGAEVPWDLLYEDEVRRKLSLPIYPFKRHRCWAEENFRETRYKFSNEGKALHPLIDRLIVKAFDERIYSKTFNPKENWVLGQHKVGDKYVLPGTAYLEMIRKVYSEALDNENIEFQKVIFMSPFSLKEDENRELQIVLKQKESFSEFIITSESEGEWIVHVEGIVRKINVEALLFCDIENEVKELKAEASERKISVEIGPRWTNISKKMYKCKNNEFIAHFNVSDEYKEDLGNYYLYPPALDRSINAANTYLGNGTYLPFSYGSMKVYGPSPKEFYSYIKRRGRNDNNSETMSFDVLLFDKTGKCFVEVKDYIVKRVKENDFKANSDDNLYHNLVWNVNEIAQKNEKYATGNTIIFTDEFGVSSQLAAKIRTEGYEVIEVKLGEGYKKLNVDNYIVGSSEQDYIEILNSIKEKDIATIIHMWTFGQEPEVEELKALKKQRQYGIDSLFFLTKALINCKYNNKIHMILVSNNANKVTGIEKNINSLSAAYFSFSKVISQEYNNITCKCIDVDDEKQAKNIISEIKYGKDINKCAYRAGIRYTEQFTDLHLEASEAHNIKLKDGGVYIITGGMGALGLEMVKYLSSKNKVNLILINRSEMPHSSEWEGIIKNGKNKKLIRAMKTIMETEAKGSKVTCYSGDSASINDMKTIIKDIKEKYYAVNGVIHCAGIAGDGFIFKKSFEDFEKVLKPKIDGSFILNSVTSDENLDFFVLFSSITSILGGQGQGDYTAANSYLDSFSEYRNKKGKRTLCINWGAFKEVGMAVDYGLDESKNSLKAIETVTAINAFDAVLNSNLNRVIIGQLNYEMLINKKEELPIYFDKKLSKVMRNKELKLKKNKSDNVKTLKEEVQLKGFGEDNVFTETEIKLAGIWAQVLGLEEVNIYDSFNNMGGDSILAIRLLKKLELEYEGMIDIADVFAYSTVNAMAKHLDEMKNKDNKTEVIIKEDLEDLDDLLNKLAQGEMTINDADKYF